MDITEERRQELAKLFIMELAEKKEVDLKGKNPWSFLIDHLFNNHFLFERYVPNEVLDIPLKISGNEEEAYEFAHLVALVCLEKKRTYEAEVDQEKKLRAVA